MKRCPKCHRFSIENSSILGIEACLFRDCQWRNINNIDLDKVKHPIRFWKFIKAFKRKV